MKRTLAALTTVLFAAALHAQTAPPDQKKEQVHKGTAAQGTVQKKEQQQVHKHDGTGKTADKK